MIILKHLGRRGSYMPLIWLSFWGLSFLLLPDEVVAQSNVPVWPQTQRLIDSAQQYSLREIVALPDSLFHPDDPREHQRLRADHPYYYRFRLPDSLMGDTSFVYADGQVDYFELLLPNGKIRVNGKQHRFTDWAIPRLYRFLPVYPGEGPVITIRLFNPIQAIKTENTQHQLFLLTVAEKDKQLLKLNKKSLVTERWDQVFLVILGTFCLMMVLRFFQNREVVFLAYASYCLSVFLFYALRFGFFLYAINLPTKKIEAEIFQSLWVFVIVLTYVWFLRVFIDRDSFAENKRLHQLLQIANWGTLAVIVVYGVQLLVIPNGIFLSPPWLILLPYGLFLIVLALHLLMKGYRYRRYVIFGSGVLVTGFLLTLLKDGIFYWTTGAVNIEVLPISYFQLAVIIEVFIFWLGLNEREKYRDRELTELEVLVNQGIIRKKESAVSKAKGAEEEEIHLKFPGDRNYTYPSDSLQYLRANKESTYLHFIGAPIIHLPYRLKDILEQLPEEYIRVHRSYVVGWQHVDKYLGGREQCFLLKDGRTKVPVGRSYLKGLTTLLDK